MPRRFLPSKRIGQISTTRKEQVRRVLLEIQLSGGMESGEAAALKTVAGGNSTPKSTRGVLDISGHFLRLRERFKLTKGKTYPIAAGGWGAEPEVS